MYCKILNHVMFPSAFSIPGELVNQAKNYEHYAGFWQNETNMWGMSVL